MENADADVISERLSDLTINTMDDDKKKVDGMPEGEVPAEGVAPEGEETKKPAEDAPAAE